MTCYYDTFSIQRSVKQLKSEYKNINFILSLGGDKDTMQPEKYLQLLKIHKIVSKYKFDGFDLAYQLPKYYENQTSVAEENARNNYPLKMTQLIITLKSILAKDNKLLSLTVLPNINVKSFYDVPAIIDNIDFITLAAFDYSTPKQTHNMANYLAPLYAPGHCNSITNVNYTLNQWRMSQRKLPFSKFNLGIPTFAHSWNTTKPLKKPHMPITKQLNGPAPGGYNTHTPGLLAWPEMCKKLSKLTRVTKKLFGSFAYRPGITKKEQGLLITYDDLDNIEEKVKYTKSNKLHGIALFDITLDDFRGKCRGERYVMLNAIKKLIKLN
ncbi:chitinase-like protein Idgf4 [Musca vetustissima]|uniref:chitinase-like protein Idgf4 n=1 Tax=Musca vetustissima TaxID=27455 RepID=UPI002AB7BED4|nr:chitinase-like protein Idgf4 [Musca vetustissima]